METYYIGKGQQGEATVVGKIVPSQKSLFVAYDGKEIPFKNYEVLVYNWIIREYNWNYEEFYELSGCTVPIKRSLHSVPLICWKDS